MADSPAMQRALAAFGALGRADRLARDATADWFDPAREHLLRRWFMFCWATREAPDQVEHFRALLRNAVACYRELRGKGRKASAGPRLAA